MIYAFFNISKKSLSTLKLLNYPHTFSSISFMLLVFTFKMAIMIQDKDLTLIFFIYNQVSKSLFIFINNHLIMN